MLEVVVGMPRGPRLFHPTINGGCNWLAISLLLLLLQGDVLGIIMRQHGGLCGLLVGELSKIKGPAATADAQLTVLANWIEDQLLHGVWPEILHEPLQRIVQAARLAASLQPDGTRLPEVSVANGVRAGRQSPFI